MVAWGADSNPPSSACWRAPGRSWSEIVICAPSSCAGLPRRQPQGEEGLNVMRSYRASETNVVREFWAFNRQIKEVLVSFYYHQSVAEGKY